MVLVIGHNCDIPSCDSPVVVTGDKTWADLNLVALLDNTVEDRTTSNTSLELVLIIC